MEPDGLQSGGWRYSVFYGLDTYLCVMDMAHIRYRYMKGRDTKYEAELEENGLDGVKSGYITECGSRDPLSGGTLPD